MDNSKLTGTILAIFVVIVGILYLLVKNGEKNRYVKSKEIEKSSIHAKGVITDIHYYKSKTLRVKYRILGEDFFYEGHWDKNPNKLDIGDSINIIYSSDNPSLSITELNNDYKY